MIRAGLDFHGFDFYGEWDRNKRYLQYPNAALFNEGEKHKVSSETSDAWHFNVERQDFPGPQYDLGDAISGDLVDMARFAVMGG